jgi:CRP-like cAMP-binding protein
VAAFLLDEAARHDGKTFTLTMSRQEIADTFAIQKFSLQRVIREFTDDGLIVTNGKTITIVDSEGLRKIKG